MPGKLLRGSSAADPAKDPGPCQDQHGDQRQLEPAIGFHLQYRIRAGDHQHEQQAIQIVHIGLTVTAVFRYLNRRNAGWQSGLRSIPKECVSLITSGRIGGSGGIPIKHRRQHQPMRGFDRLLVDGVRLAENGMY
jgi:hypothetical protein